LDPGVVSIGMNYLSFQKCRRGLCLLRLSVCFMLTACSPNFIEFQAPEAAAPAISGSIFTTFDSTELSLRAWLPSDKIDGVIIALHGFNDYSNFMQEPALFFNRHRLAVYAYDQRGFGKSKTPGRWGGAQALADDLVTFTALIKAAHPETPLYILGESMGGAVTITAMTGENPPEVDGLILVAPAVWARSEMPFYQRYALALAAYTIPWVKVTGEALDITPSDNTEMLRELGRDPLVVKETRVDALYGLSNLMDKAYAAAEQMRDRLLLVYGEKDEIIPREPVLAFHQRLPLRSRGKQQMLLYDQGYHMLLRDLQAAVVMEDIVAWINSGTEPAAYP